MPGRDPLLLPLAGLLTGWGLLLIARLADVTFLLRQCIWLAISITVFLLIVARPPGLRWLRRYRYTWLLGGLALLATTPTTVLARVARLMIDLPTSVLSVASVSA